MKTCVIFFPAFNFKIKIFGDWEWEVKYLKFINFGGVYILRLSRILVFLVKYPGKIKI